MTLKKNNKKVNAQSLTEGEAMAEKAHQSEIGVSLLDAL